MADAFILMRYPFDSEEAQLLNKQIFETIYYGALEASYELAEQLGTYESYPGCPVSKGVGALFFLIVHDSIAFKLMILSRLIDSAV